MRTNRIGTSLLVVALAFSSVAFAQGNSRHDRDDKSKKWDKPNNHGRRDYDEGRWPRQEELRIKRGAGPDHDFREGGHLPYEYRHYRYVVEDWGVHKLHRPPRGYHWVQIGSDYVLIAIATGLIVKILLSQ